MTRTPAFPKVKYTDLNQWQLLAITSAVEAYAGQMERTSGAALIDLLRNATQVRVTYKEV